MSIKLYSQLPRDIYQRVLEDVVVAVNLLQHEFRETAGKRGMDPAKNYNMVYDKRVSQLFVEFWYGPKEMARAHNKIERYTVAEVCANAGANTGGAFEAFKKKEVII